jgi:nitroreductase
MKVAMPEIGLFEAMYSARALRRLKPDPVPDANVTRVLDAAIRAPSAGNAQNWVFIVVRDAGNGISLASSTARPPTLRPRSTRRAAARRT